MEKQDKKVEKIKQSKDNSKKKKVLKYVLNGLLWALILGFLTYGGLRVADVKSGYKVLPSHSAVIVSDSMSYVNEANYSYLDKDNTKPIKKNDVIHTTNYKNFDEVKPIEDVVIYMSKDGMLICHRVIDKYEDAGIKYVVTRGDANNVDDAPVNYDLIRGRVTSVTGGGGVVLFFQSPYFVLALCCSGFFILLGYLIFNIKADKKTKLETANLQISTKDDSMNEKKPEVEPTSTVNKDLASEQKPENTNLNVGKYKVENPGYNLPMYGGDMSPKKKINLESDIYKDVKKKPVPPSAGQNKINWPPKNTRWTKDNNPTINKKRAEDAAKNGENK